MDCSAKTPKKINIMLLRFPDKGSKLLGFFKRSFYTHASIGLSEDMNTFYSFVNKGFLVEKITKYVRPDREPYPCSLYELEVSDKIYNAVKKILHEFEERKGIYRYATLGVIMGIMRIPIRRKNYFFCSHFVAEVLKRSKAVVLKKNTALYYAKDFTKIPGMLLKFKGDLLNYIHHFALPREMA